MVAHALRSLRLAALLILLIQTGALVSAQALAALPAASPVTRQAAVDTVFAAWNTSTPGCAVGVAEKGTPVLQRAYGMAELEHAVPNRPETIFEAGSVSKQFTAAAVILLALDGKLSLDDEVRKHIPELPVYEAPLTIRQMLSHTSGLRDWGSLTAVAGMPRGSRAYTHAHVVDMLSRQQAVNFTPGTRWSYSNSGYNLAAVIVARVSGLSFAEFSRTRIFEPLGLAHTSWRDDFTRVVPGRAIGYSPQGTTLRFRQDMPFENVHGNGGLLTTVGDLLKWQLALNSGPFATNGLAAQQQTMARLPDGRALHYGLGVFTGVYNGVPEVNHSGATAGYRAFLTYYPSADLTVTVLCNAANANPTQLSRSVSDIYLGGRANPGAPRSTTLPEAHGPLAGVTRDGAYTPSAADLNAFVGTYVSDEVESQLIASIENGALVLRRRPDTLITMRPHSRDRFEAGAGLGQVTFHRDNGRVVALGVTQDRVWDLRFTKLGGAEQTRPPLGAAEVTAIAELLQLEDTRRFDEPALTRLLAATHPDVRRRAVVTIGRIPHERGFALLEPLAMGADSQIHATVAFALGQVQDPAAVPWLAHTLAQWRVNADAAFEAARALGKLRTPEARAHLERFLGEVPNGPVARIVVGEALVSLGRYTDPGSLDPILRWATVDDVEVRWRATWALFRPRNPEAASHLLTLSSDASPEVRFWAMRGLAPALMTDPLMGSARLRDALTDTDRRVRAEALRGLTAYDDDLSVEAVLAALENPDTWMSVSAAESLGRHRNRIAQIAPKLAAASAATQPLALRLATLAPLAQLAPPLALDVAGSLLGHPSLLARTVATQVLRNMGPLGQQRLQAAATDPALKDLLIAPPTGRGGGAAVPAAVERDLDDYRAIVERWIVPAWNGAPAPRAVWMTPKGEIELELFAADAPLGMEELVRLTDSGAIVGTVFMRVVPNFVAQQATVQGAHRLRDEVNRHGLTRANLAWASSGLDTGRPGYTLGNTPQPHNEGDFTSLGRVVRGMEVVDRLALGDTVLEARMVKGQ